MTKRTAGQTILALLADGEQYAEQLVKRSKKLTKQNIYVHLRRLYDKGLITYREEHVPGVSRGSKRKYWRLL